MLKLEFEIHQLRNDNVKVCKRILTVYSEIIVGPRCFNAGASHAWRPPANNNGPTMNLPYTAI